MHDGAVSIFTDGSRCSTGVGYSVITPETTIKKRVSISFSIFSAELLAVLSALVFIFNNGSSNKFVIHTDCMSILSSLGGMFTENPIVCQIHDWLVLLANRKKIKIVFCWVPSHVGIRGNELN